MIVKTFPMGPLQVNTNLIACENTKKAALIDFGGYDLEKIETYIQKNNLSLEYLLLTHGHFDHVYGAGTLQEKYTLPVYLHEGDKFLLDMLEQQLLSYGMKPKKPPENITYINDGDTITLGELEIKVLTTPGHSQGSVSYYIEAASTVFVGDTIFMGAVGRTDLPGGSTATLMDSITTKLLTLPDDTAVYCGHGPVTTIGEERVNNPFFGTKSKI